MVTWHASGFLTLLLALAGAPLLHGIINRTKAFFAGRRGKPVWQLYADLRRLLGKGAVYSHTTTWVFVAGPLIGLACLITALTMMPLGGMAACLSFDGDLLLVAYLLGLLRFVTILAALDTGSAFEGMGASREASFAALAEPPFFICLAVLAHRTGSLSLSGIYNALTPEFFLQGAPILILLVVALFLVFLAENARIPLDDPNTHLELTMIHEVMVLDHSGPDFALILYGTSLKLWLLGSLIIGILFPMGNAWYFTLPTMIGGLFALAILTGMVESGMARFRLTKVPNMLFGALVLAILALVLVVR